MHIGSGFIFQADNCFLLVACSHCNSFGLRLTTHKLLTADRYLRGASLCFPKQSCSSAILQALGLLLSLSLSGAVVSYLPSDCLYPLVPIKDHENQCFQQCQPLPFKLCIRFVLRICSGRLAPESRQAQ